MPYRVLDEDLGAPHRRRGDPRLCDQARPLEGRRRRTRSCTRRPAGGSATAFWSRDWRNACAWWSGRTICRSPPPLSGRCIITINFRGIRTAARSFSGSSPAGSTSAGRRRGGARCWSLRRIRRARLGVSGNRRRAARRLVCRLHVRDISWKGLTAGLHAIRNADTASYLPAIGEITRRGGFVIRMGDRDGAAAAARQRYRLLPQRHARGLDGYFPYCPQPFHPGICVGPDFVPPLYGVPVVLTNWWPPGMRPWHAWDIFIPKLAAGADGSYLTLSETLQEPFSYCHSLRYLRAREGILVEDNDPELIRGAVAECCRGWMRRVAAPTWRTARACRSHLPIARAFRHGAARGRVSPASWRFC